MTNSSIIASLLIYLLPLVIFGILYFWANNLPRKGDWLATGVMGLCVVLSCLVFANTWGTTGVLYKIQWFVLPGLVKDIPFYISIALTPLSSLMLVVVTLISFLVHLYSIEYMYDKKNYFRYFPYLGLFTSSMIGIVLSDNLLVTFMFWELVGFASYLLIGFWMEKPAAASASKKAFLINRIGDAGFLLGLCIVYLKFETFELSLISSQLQQTAITTEWLYTIAGIGIFMGCVGKSAQFPLQLWLPDAMEGPTPASALIHAATMVAAGIYLLAKTYVLLNADVHVLISFIGAVTALMGALPAIAQTDIKKVLAYSTISQLGFMVMAMGVNAYDAALFHLVTHAFFKACLFLTAGAVIHEMHHVKQAMFIRGYFQNFDTLNMKIMGGLRKRMPITFSAYFVSSMALIGVPLFSGFLSKDAILEGTLDWAAHQQIENGSYLYYAVPAIAIITIAVTAYYMIRQMLLVFFGPFKLKTFYTQVEPAFEKIHDPGWLMKFPMIVLGTLSIFLFYSMNPFNGHHGWLMEGLSFVREDSLVSTTIVVLSSIGAVGLGVSVAWFRFKPSTYAIIEEDETSSLKRLLKNNWYMDVLYARLLVAPGRKLATLLQWFDKHVVDGLVHVSAYISVLFALFLSFVDTYLVDGCVNLLAWLSAKIGGILKGYQQGTVQNYFAYALLCIAALFVWLIVY